MQSIQKQQLLDAVLLGKDSNDSLSLVNPVYSYLRKAGKTELLTREGEVELSRRIERGWSQIADAIEFAGLNYEKVFASDGEKKSGDILPLEKHGFGEEDNNNDIQTETQPDSIVAAFKNHYGRLEHARGEISAVENCNGMHADDIRKNLQRMKLNSASKKGIRRKLGRKQLELVSAIDAISESVDTIMEIENKLRHPTRSKQFRKLS